MPTPVFKGFGHKLKGAVGKTSPLFFSATDVLTNAKVKIRGRGPALSNTVYEWFGIYRGGSGNGKIKMTVECLAGDTMFFKRGRKRGLVFGAGDLIDVTVTVTNPGEAEVVPPNPNGVVEII